MIQIEPSNMGAVSQNSWRLASSEPSEIGLLVRQCTGASIKRMGFESLTVSRIDLIDR